MIPTASHTTGPFFPADFIRPGDHDLTVGRDGTAVQGTAIAIEGRILDSLGDPLVNAIIELWQADPTGRFPGPADSFKGWGRTWTDAEGRYRFRTLKPGPVSLPGSGGWVRPPHFSILILGSGLMRPLSTQLFFPGEPLNDVDRQLALITDADGRRRLLLRPDPDAAGEFQFDFRLGGPDETPFLVD